MDLILSKKEQNYLKNNYRFQISNKIESIQINFQQALEKFDIEHLVQRLQSNQNLILIQKLKGEPVIQEDQQNIQQIFERHNKEIQKDFKNKIAILYLQPDDYILSQDKLLSQIEDEIIQVQNMYEIKPIIILQEFEEIIGKTQLIYGGSQGTMNKTDFQQLLYQIQIRNKVNYELIEEQKDLLRYIKNIVSLLAKQSTFSNKNFFDSKAKQDNSKSILLGLTDESQLLLVWLLRAIPKITETKSTAIVKKYKSLKGLLEAYKQQQTIQEQKQMLENLPVISINQGETKFGRNSSEKVYEFIHCKNHTKVLS